MSDPRLQFDLQRSATGASEGIDGTSVFHCLVVSESPIRCGMLRAAAHEAGWQTIVAEDASGALRQAAIQKTQLAIVDLDSVSAATRVELLEILPRLSAAGGLLLMVCGNPDDVQEELAARRHGVWMYLPGVVEGSGVASLCIEAREIAARLRVPRPHVAMGAASAPALRRKQRETRRRRR